MLNSLKNELLNLGLKFISVDEKIVRLFLETSPSNVNEIVVLPAAKLFMKKIVDNLQNKKVYGRVHNGLLNGVRVSVVCSSVGSPNCAIAVESLKRCKTKIIVRVDFCGGIPGDSKDVSIGDILIPKIAYCDDGTSPQYVRNNTELLNQLNSIPNPVLKFQNLKTGNQTIFISKPNEQLMNLLLNDGVSSFPGRVKIADFWTTDALFCESFDFIKALKSINVQGIDMESSILFLLGSLYKLKTASVLSVSDIPCHPKYDLLNSNEIHPDLEKGIDNAIKILTNSLPKIKSDL